MEDLRQQLIKARDYLDSELIDLAGNGPNFSSKSNDWEIEMNYSFYSNLIFLDIQLTPTTVNLDYNEFALYNVSMGYIWKLFGMDAKRLEQSGKTSKMSSAFCSTISTSRLLDFSGSKLGWKNKGIFFHAELSEKEIPTAKNIFGDLLMIAQEVNPLLEVI